MHTYAQSILRYLETAWLHDFGRALASMGLGLEGAGANEEDGFDYDA